MWKSHVLVKISSLESPTFWWKSHNWLKIANFGENLKKMWFLSKFHNKYVNFNSFKTQKYCLCFVVYVNFETQKNFGKKNVGSKKVVGLQKNLNKENVGKKKC